MNNIASQWLCVLLAERPGTGSFHLAVAAPDAAPEYVVFTPGVDANHSPHLMIVGHDRHSGPPDDVENCQSLRVVEFLNFSTPGLAEPLENGRGVGDHTGNDFAHRFVRFVLGHRTAAVRDELIDVEHDPTPLLEPMVMARYYPERAGANSVAFKRKTQRG